MNIHTDMAVELQETHRFTHQDGFYETSTDEGGIQVNRVRMEHGRAAEKTGKAPGRYVTVFLDGTNENEDLFLRAAEQIATELRCLLGATQGSVLCVGIGNPHLTADTLGPTTADGLIATRHLETLPDFQSWSLGRVAVLKTGVLAQTGMESADLVEATVRQIKPSAVILFDALASRHTERLCTTVQLADSGMSPGSGIGNHRREISKKSLGIPVISVGIPTVVRAQTLAYDMLCAATKPPDPDTAKALRNYDSNWIVTPSDIDEKIAKGARLLSLATNKALHHDLTLEEIETLRKQ